MGGSSPDTKENFPGNVRVTWFKKRPQLWGAVRSCAAARTGRGDQSSLSRLLPSDV